MKKVNPFLVDVTLRTTLYLAEEDALSGELEPHVHQILENKLKDKINSGEWCEDVRFLPDTERLDLAGEYTSFDDFINQNQLNHVATTMLGPNWESEDDANMVSDFISAIGEDFAYLVVHVGHENIDRDIIVTSLKKTKLYLDRFHDYEVKTSSNDHLFYLRDIDNIDTDSVARMLLQQLRPELQQYLGDDLSLTYSASHVETPTIRYCLSFTPINGQRENIYLIIERKPNVFVKVRN